MDVRASRRALALLPERLVKAPVAATPVPVAVVQEARAGLGENAVSLCERAKARLSLRRVRNVGVESPGCRMKSLLDGLVVRITRHPEELVVIGLRLHHALFWPVARRAPHPSRRSDVVLLR